MNLFLEKINKMQQQNFNVESVTFNFSNIVMGVIFNENFNIPNLLELLPCVYVPDFQHKKTKTIPFFGIPNCIVSCQGEKEWRGVRNSSGFKNAVCLDFQNEIKNVHIKITSNKFHITGAKSYEMGMETSMSCIRLINETDAIWKSFYSLPPEMRCKICQTAISLLIQDGTMFMFDSIEVYERFEQIPLFMYPYATIIYSMISFSYDYRSIELFYMKMNRLLNVQPCQKSLFHNGDEIIINSSKIYNGVYKYKYPFKIFLPEMSKHLFALGYVVEYHNIGKSNKMEVVIPVISENCEEGETDNDSPISSLSSTSSLPLLPKKKTSVKYRKVQAHKFNINTNGSVQQTSPTSSPIAYAKFVQLRQDIFKIMYDEYLLENQPTKKITLTENEKINQTIESMLSYYDSIEDDEEDDNE